MKTKPNKHETEAVPASYLLHARALSAWANAAGMTPTQKDIHLYVGSVLSTCPECWISVSELARRIGRTRRGVQKAVVDGKDYVEHDEDGKGTGTVKDDEKLRLWTLVLPLPSRAELDKFMPHKRAEWERPTGVPTQAKGMQTKFAGPCEQSSYPPVNGVHTEKEHSPSVRVLQENGRSVSPSGGSPGPTPPIASKGDQDGTAARTAAQPKPNSSDILDALADSLGLVGPSSGWGAAEKRLLCRVAERQPLNLVVGWLIARRGCASRCAAIGLVDMAHRCARLAPAREPALT